MLQAGLYLGVDCPIPVDRRVSLSLAPYLRLAPVQAKDAHRRLDGVRRPAGTSWRSPGTGTAAARSNCSWRRKRPAGLAAPGITLSMIGLDIALNLHKRKQLPSYRYAVRPQEDFGREAWRLYREGERLLALGALEEARAEYGRIVRFYGGSDALPWAACRIADILYLEGDHAAAGR